MTTSTLAPLVFLLAATAAGGDGVIRVDDDAALRAALGRAGPGTQIRIAPGRYRPGISAAHLVGTPEAPIVIEGADPENPPQFEGGSGAWHLSDCAYLTLRNLDVRGQAHNGINIDDGGSYDSAGAAASFAPWSGCAGATAVSPTSSKGLR